VSSLFLVGVTVISLSFVPGEREVLRNIIRELGIVLVSVFGVSILYEIFIAEQHFEQFRGALVKIIQSGETNAAVCSRLGVERIFPTRSEYMSQYDFRQLCAQMTAGSRLRIVGNSLFVISYYERELLDALKEGAVIELGVLDRTVPAETFEQIKHSVKEGELIIALERLAELEAEIRNASLPGTLEIREHRMPLLESYFEYKGSKEEFAVWDISFGPDSGQKRVFLLDPEKPFGRDLANRYDRIWRNGKVIFKYPASGSDLSLSEATTA
jgi:hypothetical protein